jgi:hypothetical protein
MALYDDTTIVVYQAYRRSIGEYAVAHQRFGGDFNFDRMSWIKPNFLWMMYRCGWATKADQECVLAVRILRHGFEQILKEAVHSSFDSQIYASNALWAAELKASPVRLQWDPDHDPRGAKMSRRAIQLGLSGAVLRSYATEWIVQIDDVTEFVTDQHQHAQSNHWDMLQVPIERPYLPASAQTAARLGLSSHVENAS